MVQTRLQILIPIQIGLSHHENKTDTPRRPLQHSHGFCPYRACLHAPGHGFAGFVRRRKNRGAVSRPSGKRPDCLVDVRYAGNYHKLDNENGNTLLLRSAVPFEVGGLNNIARATAYALAAIFSGTRSMNLACFDEVYAIPSDLAIRTSLRIQQTLAYETGVGDVVDPLGGSYYLESLTNEMEAKMVEILESIERKRGIVQAIESGEIQRELAQQSYLLQKKLNSGERVSVGVNRFSVKEEERDLEIYKIDPETRDRQIARLHRIKEERDGVRVAQSLESP